MIVRLGMAPRLPGTTFSAFQRHWASDHADAVSTMPRLQRYVQHHGLLDDDGHPTLPYPGFDACSELYFADLAAMDAAFASEAFTTTVQADERAFVDKTRFTGVIGTREVLAGDPDDAASDGRVEVVTLWRATEAAGRERLLEALAGGPVAPGGAVDHARIVADPAAHAARFPAGCDVVEVRGYASRDAAVASAREPEVVALERDLAGVGQAVGRHLARAVDVDLRR